MNHASFIIFFIFIVLPLTELYLLFKIAAVIGGWETFALVIITGVVGASLARAQGIACLERIRSNLNRSQLPTREMAAGVLILAASLLLITPGVVTDIVGFLLLVPPLRSAAARTAMHIMKNRIHHTTIHMHPPPANPPRTSRHDADDNIIDVQAESIDEEEL